LIETTQTTGEIQMAQVMVETADLQRWARTIKSLSEFVLLSHAAKEEQRIEMAALGNVMADLIERRVSNVTDDSDDFGAGIDRITIDYSGMPVLAGNDGGLS
jgi:hypothetical protein